MQIGRKFGHLSWCLAVVCCWGIASASDTVGPTVQQQPTVEKRYHSADGVARLHFDFSALSTAGLGAIKLPDSIEFEVIESEPVMWASVVNDRFASVLDGGLSTFPTKVQINAADGTGVTLGSMRWVLSEDKTHWTGHDGTDDGDALFVVTGVNAGFDPEEQVLHLAGDAAFSDVMADILGAPDAAGSVIGQIVFSVRLNLNQTVERDADGRPISGVIHATGGQTVGDGQTADSVVGPDVTVSYIGPSSGGGTEPVENGAVGSIGAYAFTTISCNLGTTNAIWIDTGAQPNRHPVISQNMYRLRDGRFEMIGMAWLKHGFCGADASGPNCATCMPDGTCDSLGVGCTDTYCAGLNAQQSGMGPHSEVNAYTGVYPYPYVLAWQQTGNAIYKRLQIAHNDLDPVMNPGAIYLGESQYVVTDEEVPQRFNNVTWRRVSVGTFGSQWALSFTGNPMPQQAAIQAWPSLDAGATVVNMDVPSEGRFMLGNKVTNLGGGQYHYEYAVYNMNSDRSGQSFAVPIPAGATISNIGFHDVDYHSGEPYTNTDWTAAQGGGFLTWSTQTFAQNANANALRWGTLYNFRFDANVAPQSGTVTLGLFKTGSPTSISATTQIPFGIPDCNGNGVADNLDIANQTSQDCDGAGVPDDCQGLCTLTTRRVASGLTLPVGVYSPPGDLNRLFIVQQGGQIRILDLTTEMITGTYLDISGLLVSGGERGLLGLAFDPAWNTNARFYVNYTRAADGATVIAQYTATGANPAASTANAGSAVILKTISQPFTNHNGGCLQFGADGMLYAAMGDGGSANDPSNLAQNTGSLLGKMLRLDVNNPGGAYIPADNPYVGAGNPLDEIWARGVRNPWRFSFDRLTGDMYIGDVGQDAREEIDFQAASSNGGENYGWDCEEGTICSPGNNGGYGCVCGTAGFIDPIYELVHGSADNPCSITGGYVYRGCDIPGLSGTYFLADYCADLIRTFRYVGGAVTQLTTRTAELTPDIGSLTGIVSFGEDGSGEMYIVSLSGGSVFKIDCAAPPPVCGNSVVETGEECDPPNGTTCDPNCQTINTGCDLIVFADNFQTDMGWTASVSGATSGQWQRGVPVNDAGWAYDPAADADGSGQCYLTQNAAGNTDVDGGSVTLSSPTIDMSNGDITISYSYYLNLTDAGGVDRLLVEISSNGAAGPWTQIALHTTNNLLAWTSHTITQSDLTTAGVTVGSNMRVRFTANDGNPQTIVESGVDAFQVCSSLVDCNNNGVADDQDIALGTSDDCNKNGIPDECEATETKEYTVTAGLPLTIPDNTPGTFVSNSFTVPDSGTIQDLNLGVAITHTYNGDLIVRLSHLGGTPVVVIDRPGYTGTGFGTDDDGFDVVLDDQGTGGAIESVTAGGGLLTSPPSYTPFAALSAFNGMEKAGLWTISVSDNAGSDVGTLNEWTLYFVNDGIEIPPCDDCNGNQIDDAVELANCSGGNPKCDDCNNNGILDECDILADPTIDCDGGPVGVGATGMTTFFANNCQFCHNNDGSGAPPTFPGPNIRNRNRVFIWDRLDAMGNHPGGQFPGFTQQDYANLEAFLADGGSRGRPDKVPDECQTPLDCDGDTFSDACELEAGTQVDADYDGVPDDCEPCENPCDDALACTINDACAGNDCVGTPVDCGPLATECMSFSCDTVGAEGNCSTMTPINQGQPCNGATGTCNNGLCQPLGDRVRVFMAADGEEGNAPLTGNTSVTVDSGGTRPVSVWMEDGVGAGPFNGYQIMIQWNASLVSGVGTARYFDIAPTGGSGNSVLLDISRPDWVFAGQPLTSVSYQEVLNSRFGFVYNLAFGTGIDASAEGIAYLGEFQIQAGAGACGEFELPFRLTLIPVSQLFTPQGNDFPVDEFQPLTVNVRSVSDECDDAIAMTGGSPSQAFNTTCATQDGAAHAGCDIDKDVWFAYAASCTGNLTVSTQSGCNFDTSIAIYQDGASCIPGDGELTTCVDTPGTCESTVVPVTFGDTLLIRVGSESGASGAGTLSLSCLPIGGPCVDAGDCGDLDFDQARDDNCVWWSCNGGSCNGIGTLFADFGGVNGACMPDGSTDANDKFHALSCFSNTNFSSTGEYDCEPDGPVSVYNVDAGGPGLTCCADGACDANDAFAVLNAFSGTSLCMTCPQNTAICVGGAENGVPCGGNASCPGGSCVIQNPGSHPCPSGGPSPVQVPAPVGHATISASAEHRTAHPGDLVSVDLYMNESQRSLRGYQLHLDVTGGLRGRLELVDVAVRDRADDVFAGSASFEAFNVRTGQMIAGLDGAGVPTNGKGYLATYTYRVSPDAAGTFVVDVLGYDPSNPDHRTFLFSSGAGIIALDRTIPATIVVTSRRAEDVRASR